MEDLTAKMPAMKLTAVSLIVSLLHARTFLAIKGVATSME